MSPVAAQPDPALASLDAAMNRCLANQAQTLEQLQRQQQQLESQQQQLQQLPDALQRAQQVALEDSSAAAPVSDNCEVSPVSENKLIVGQLEQVWLHNLQLALPARIDTGAETASLDARNIQLFERNGRRWVRFEILHPETGESVPVERKLKRMVAIVQSNTAESERRPVIKMGITIGSISQTAEFTLSDRSHLDYQVLVGRNILRDVMIVDVSEQNIVPIVAPQQPGAIGTEP